MRISTIMDLNDPFEFFSVNLGNKKFRRAMTAVKQGISAKRGIICFSKSWCNPLLWSHYADKHRGICLGIDFPSQNLTKMRYRRSRVQIARHLNEAWMNEVLVTKFSHWRYEQEHRAFLSLDEMDADGNYYLDFSDQVSLREVIVGTSSKLTRGEVLDALGPEKKDVEVFKSRPAFRKFEVVRNLNQKLWV